MADPEKVMQGLRCHSEPKQGMEECFCELCPYDECTCGLDVPSDALKLVEKQVPKPVVDVAEFDQEIAVGCCPSCGKKIVNNSGDPTRFCKFCGKAVKWDD